MRDFVRHTRLNEGMNNITEFRNFKFVNPNSIRRFFNSERCYSSFRKLYFNFNLPLFHKPFLNKFMFFKSKTIGANSYLTAIWMWVKRTIVLIPNSKTENVNFIKNILTNYFSINRIKNSIYGGKIRMGYRMIIVMFSFFSIYMKRRFFLLKNMVGKIFLPFEIIFKLLALIYRKSISICGFNKASISKKRAINNLFSVVVNFFFVIFFGKRISFSSFSWFSIVSCFPFARPRTIKTSFVRRIKLIAAYFAYLHRSIIYYTDSFVNKILRDYTPTPLIG